MFKMNVYSVTQSLTNGFFLSNEGGKLVLTKSGQKFKFGKNEKLKNLIKYILIFLNLIYF